MLQKPVRGNSIGAMEMMLSKRTRSMYQAADWTSLPPELLLLIAKKLTNIFDYIHFRSVCTSWRLVATPTDLPPQFPLLVEHEGSCVGKYGDEYNHTSSISLINPSDGYRCVLDVPEAQGKWTYGTAFGWLVMVEDPNPPAGLSVSLLNPITRAHISLPTLPDSIELSCLLQVLLCCHPASARPHQLLLVVWDHNELAVFRQGDQSWTAVYGPLRSCFDDIACFDGALYSVYEKGRLALLDIASSEVRDLITIPPEVDLRKPTFHLVVAAGDLLLLAWQSSSSDGELRAYKLDRSTKEELKWARVTDSIGNSTLFLNSNQSLSICARDFPNQGGNKIYLSNCFYGRRQGRKMGYSSIQVLDALAAVKNGQARAPATEIQRVSGEQIMPVASWIVPSLL